MFSLRQLQIYHGLNKLRKTCLTSLKRNLLERERDVQSEMIDHFDTKFRIVISAKISCWSNVHTLKLRHNIRRFLYLS